MLREEILKIIEEYGASVDPQGWQIEERYEAVEKIIQLIEKNNL